MGGGAVAAPRPRAGARSRVGVKRHRPSALQPERLAVHGEPQHLQRGLEGSVGGLSLLTNDAVARRNVLAPGC